MAVDSPKPALAWEYYRAYLRFLARLRLPPRLWSKIDASDVIQETLLEAHRAVERLAEMNETERLAFLRRILGNNLTDLARRYAAEARDVGRERRLEDQLQESSARLAQRLAAAQSSPSQRASREEELLKLAAALARLPEAQRLAVEMKHLRGYAIAEIAKSLDRSETAVGGLLRRGIKRLRELSQEVQLE
jgi:RNA polymerase sigma-70 factor, ECF subfamily